MPKEDYQYVPFGKHLKRLIKEKYPKVELFADAIGLDASLIYDYQSGRVFPPLEKFIKICEGLNKTPSYMLLPFLNLKQIDRKFLETFNRLRTIYEDEELSNFCDAIMTGLEIVQIQKRKFKETNILGVLEKLKEFLIKTKL